MNRGLSTLALLTILSGCATVPPVCQEPPKLTARVPMGPSFQDRMRDFLSGKLPEQTNSERH